MRSTSKSILKKIPPSDLFQKISDICSAVNTVISPKELLEVSLKGTMELFGAKRGSIFILKDNGKDLILKIAQGMESAEQEKMVKRLGEGIVGKVAVLKQPVIVDDIAKDRRFRDLKPRGSYSTPSFICAPLIIKDKLIGVINITDKESGHRFNKDEMQLLDFLTSQIALNYRRVELYKKFKTIVREAKSLKNRLGQTDQEAKHLKKQIVVQEKLATIGKLAGGIAHEFNNPLDGVMRYTNLCLDHVKDNEVVRGYLVEIKHGLKRMANIVKNLLACSRNDQPTREKIELAKAFEYALIAKEIDIAHKNILIEQKIDAGIPLVQDLGLERILANLLNNAVDAIGRDGRITFKAGHEQGVLTFSIADTGIGIPVGDVQKIFEPFYTTKDIDKGCGLGLTIVGEIIKGYNGKISVQSKVGKGTTFTIQLPLDDDYDSGR